MGDAASHPGAPRPRQQVPREVEQVHRCMQQGLQDLGREVKAAELGNLQDHVRYPQGVSRNPSAHVGATMTATDGGAIIPMTNGFTVDGIPLAAGSHAIYHNGVYHFLKRNSVDIPLCKPSVFLEGLLRVRGLL